MRLAFVQMDAREGAPDDNRRTVESAVREAARAGASVVALPEMWCSGYDLEKTVGLDGWAPDFAGLAALSDETGVAILGGSLLEKTPEGTYNCSISVDGGSEVSRYRKQHLFKPLDEHLHLVEGPDRPPIFTIRGWRVATAICYDLRFPEVFRPLAVDGVELIYVPAQWPAARIEQWRTLLRARAIESQCYVLGVNRCGYYKDLRFPGHSILVSPTGDVIADAGESCGTIHATLERAQVTGLREGFPVLRDRRDDQYPL